MASNTSAIPNIPPYPGECEVELKIKLKVKSEEDWNYTHSSEISEIKDFFELELGFDVVSITA